MTPRSSPPEVRVLPVEWYSLRRLSEAWGVKPGTIRVWLHDARRAGKGPNPTEYRLKRLNRARRWLELRGDYAKRLHDLACARPLAVVKRNLSPRP